MWSRTKIITEYRQSGWGQYNGAGAEMGTNYFTVSSSSAHSPAAAHFKGVFWESVCASARALFSTHFVVWFTVGVRPRLTTLWLRMVFASRALTDGFRRVLQSPDHCHTCHISAALVTTPLRFFVSLRFTILWKSVVNFARYTYTEV